MRHLKLQATQVLALRSLISVGVWACVACAATEEAPPTTFGSGTAGTAGSAGTRSYSGPVGSGTAGVAAVTTGGVASGAGSGGQPTSGAGGAGAGTAGTTTAGATATGGSAGNGGVVGAGGSPPAPPSICDGAATRVLTTSKADALVDDFQAASLSPNWSHFSDVMPVPNAFKILQVTTDGAATTSKSSRYQGTDAKTLSDGGYGVGVVYNVAINKARSEYCVDISAFEGVSFWAKAAPAGAVVEVNFVVPETNAAQDGGDCLAGCYNHPRTTVTLTESWAQYTVKFSEAQLGAYPVKKRVQMLAFLVPSSSDWDYSLDEIAWYKGTAPSGPVAP